MESVLEKIKKLIDHERSARSIGSTAEAQAFAERIQQMLLKHKVSMSEVEMASLDAEDPIGISSARTRAKRVERWRQILAGGIANSFFCKLLKTVEGSHGVEFVFIGRTGDRTAAMEMYQHLSGIAPRLSKEFVLKSALSVEAILAKWECTRLQGRTAYAKQLYKKASRTAQKDFLTGFVTAICKRLESGRKFIEAGASTAATGLILRDKQAIEQFAREHFQMEKGRQIPAPKITIAGAAQAGYQAGMSVTMASMPALCAGD
jgi:hypothetical protein